jgi:hypothetical protein
MRSLVAVTPVTRGGEVDHNTTTPTTETRRHGENLQIDKKLFFFILWNFSVPPCLRGEVLGVQNKAKFSCDGGWELVI